MTPKEKAQELLSKYTSITLKEVVPGIFLAFDEELCKKFALIAVDEILQILSTSTILFKADKDLNFLNSYYLEVKQEIEAL
jgi:hypothetical protein